MFAFASSWNMYSLPVRLAGSPVQRSFASTPKRTPRAGQERIFGLQNERLRVQLLPGSPRRTVHLASAALDACKRVQDNLAAEILDGFQADFFLLEIEVRNLSELRRFEKHGDRREH